MAAAAHRALDLTGRLIDTFGRRPAGSNNSRGAADGLRHLRVIAASWDAEESGTYRIVFSFTGGPGPDVIMVYLDPFIVKD